MNIDPKLSFPTHFFLKPNFRICLEICCNKTPVCFTRDIRTVYGSSRRITTQQTLNQEWRPRSRKWSRVFCSACSKPHWPIPFLKRLRSPCRQLSQLVVLWDAFRQPSFQMSLPKKHLAVANAVHSNWGKHQKSSLLLLRLNDCNPITLFN